MTKDRRLRIYERDRIYPQSISYYHKLMYLSPNEHDYVANHWEVKSFVNDYFYWARDIDKLGESARSWINLWVNNKKKWQEIKSLYENDYQKIPSILLPLHDKIISECPNDELNQLYTSVLGFAEEHINYSEYSIDLFDDFFSEVFCDYLRIKYQLELTGSELADLLKPATLSAQAKYRKELLMLALSLSHATPAQLRDYFCWTKMSWDGSNELTTHEIMNDLTDAQKKEVKDLKDEYDRLDKYEKNVLNERNGILARNKLNLSDKNLANYFILLDAFNIFHDYRKEIQMRSNQIIYRVLHEIPRRFNVDYNDLLYYYPDEIIALLKNGDIVDTDIIKKRHQGITYLIEDGKVKEFIGDEAKRILEEYVLSTRKKENVNKIVGIPASKGKIHGIVFVTKIVREANETLPSGHILVTSMTSVDYVPAMRRAAAIITDDGGITCHAAVLGRELGIPCIVGTKIATTVLKTGDKIEMDATKGIITIQ